MTQGFIFAIQSRRSWGRDIEDATKVMVEHLDYMSRQPSRPSLQGSNALQYAIGCFCVLGGMLLAVTALSKFLSASIDFGLLGQSIRADGFRFLIAGIGSTAVGLFCMWRALA